MPDLFETLKRLVSAHSVSGSEDEIRAVLSEYAKAHADELFTDTLGNLIAVKRAARGGGKKVMLSAHMDSIGVIATHIDDRGFVRFSNVGGLLPEVLPATPVVFRNGTAGVISRDGEANAKELKISDLYIDIGASSREEAEKAVRVSDTAVYATETRLLGEGRVVSPYLDNRVSCLVLLAALEGIKESFNDLFFVFSVQEEVGLRGAGTAAFHIDPDVGLAVDVTRTGDTPKPSPKMECALGGGAAIKVMDSSLICSPRLVRALENTAKRAGIRYQFEVLERGGTDSAAIQRTRGGVHSGCVSIPARYIHTPQEAADLNDVRAVIALVSAFAANPIEL